MITQKDVHALRKRSCSFCESSVRLGHHDGLTAWLRHLFATKRWRHPVKCLAQGHNKQACRLTLHTIFFVLSAKQGSCEYHFLKSFGMTLLGKMNPQVYRLRSVRSIHYAIAPVLEINDIKFRVCMSSSFKRIKLKMQSNLKSLVVASPIIV